MDSSCLGLNCVPWFLFLRWIFRDCCLPVLLEGLAGVFMGMLAGVRDGGMGGQGEMACGIQKRFWHREGKLPLVFCCSARGDPESWIWGNRESGRGSHTAYLLFWLVVEQWVSSQFGNWGTAMRQEGKDRGRWSVGSTGRVHSGEGRCNWCSVSALRAALKTGSRKRVWMVHGQPSWSQSKCCLRLSRGLPDILL